MKRRPYPTMENLGGNMHRQYLRREIEREWEELQDDEKLVEAEKKKIIEEWVAIEKHQKEYEYKRQSFEKQVLEHFEFLPQKEVVSFNVGGQVFKSTVEVWTRDRFSILAQLCTTRPRLQKSLLSLDNDVYFFDRDFWIFQHIYTFLRENVLPDHIDVLRELYYEASFYRIGLLRHGIEAKMLGEEPLLLNSVAILNQKSIVKSGMRGEKQEENFHPAIVHPETVEKNKSFSLETNNADRHEHSINKYRELPDPFGFTSKRQQNITTSIV